MRLRTSPARHYAGFRSPRQAGWRNVRVAVAAPPARRTDAAGTAPDTAQQLALQAAMQTELSAQVEQMTAMLAATQQQNAMLMQQMAELQARMLSVMTSA